MNWKPFVGIMQYDENMLYARHAYGSCNRLNLSEKYLTFF